MYLVKRISFFEHISPRFIATSLLIHAVIIWLISQQLHFNTPLQQAEKQAVAINSYLYVRPKPAPEQVHTTPRFQTQKPVAAKNNNKQLRSKKRKTQEMQIEQLAPSKAVTKPAKTAEPRALTPSLSRSPQQILQQLQTELNQQAAADASFEHYRKKSISPLHATPNFVPHSKKQLTPEEKHQKNTTDFGRFKVTKGDDGNCTIVTDLTAVGMEGVTAVEGFKCGQTKLEKAYDKHMNAVLKKLGKK